MKGLPNAARGEVMLAIDGAPRRLCVTLGALAELEAAFDVAAFADLGDRLQHMTASDLLIVVSALCAGGGDPVSVSELAAGRIDPSEAARAVGEAFRLAFADNA
jgi:hypothetical protein